MIELKGTAPQESQIEENERIETCAGIVNQVGKAAGQVLIREVPRLGPTIHVRTTMREIEETACGGTAIATTVIPDGHLLGRRDIAIEGQAGCPDNSRCTDRCLRANLDEYRVSLVGLLWMQKRRGGAATGEFTRCLGAAEALNIALWAGSGRVADQALVALARESRAVAPHLAEDLMAAALASSRRLTTRQAREEAVDAMHGESVATRRAAKRLSAEVRRGLAEPRPLIGLAEFAERFRNPEEPSDGAEVFFEGDGYVGGGSVVDQWLRMAPSPALWRDALSESADGFRLLDRASDALSRSVLPRVWGNDVVMEPEPVMIRLGDEAIEIGREWPGLLSNANWPPHLRRELLRAREALRHGDWYWMNHFIHARLPGMLSAREFGRIHDNWCLRNDHRFPFMAAWASSDGRLAISA